MIIKAQRKRFCGVSMREENLSKTAKNMLTYNIRFGIIISVATRKAYGSIAQLGEHLPYKQGVTGSSPVVPTIPQLDIAEHGRVVQLVRTPACHAGGRGFEPLLGRHFAQIAQ